MATLDLHSFRIVSPKNPSPAEAHAVDEVGYWISKITGSPPEVTNEEGGGGALALVPDPSMGQEEFSILPAGSGVRILGGRPRGLLYGAYEFLERYLGFRWLAEDETIIPRPADVQVSEYAYCPVLEYREPYFTEAFDGDWAARNRMNSNAARLTEVHGGRITYVGFVHTFNNLVPPEEFFGDHPEYFSEIDGARISDRTQLCLTNPEVVRIAARRAVAWLRENPEANIISVSQNDWRNPCQCRSCSEIDEEEGTHAGSLLAFVNQVSELIEKEFPDVWVDTLAYTYTRKATKNIRPRRNVLVRLCSIECCFSHPLSSCPENSSFKKDTEEWAKIAHTLYVWDYVTNFSHYIMPFPNLRVLQPNVQFFVENNVRGIFEEGNYSPGGGGEFAALRSYLLARILWDPECDSESAMDEFLSGYYGEAAGPIRTYVESLHDRVERRNLHVRIYDKPGHFLDPEFVDHSLSLLDEAEGKVSSATRKRVRLQRLPLTYSQISLMEGDDPRRAPLLKEFITECRSMGITNISEGTTLEDFEKAELS